MLRKVSKTQTDTITWAADNGGAGADLERVGYITRIDVTAEITPSATLTGAGTVTDGLWRVFRNIKIVGGSHTYITLPNDDAGMGGTLLHYLSENDGHGRGHHDGPITAPNRTYVPITATLHFGSRPRTPSGWDNKFDMSGFIPAAEESQLRIEVQTSGNDVMDETVTITSGVYRFAIHRVVGDPGEIRAEIARQGVRDLVVPAWTAENFAHTAARADYTEERDLPTGGFLKRIAIAEQDATADRSLRAQDEATGFAIKLPDQNEEVIRVFADSLGAHLLPGSNLMDGTTAPDFGGFAPRGIYLLDLRPHVWTHPDLGLDLRGLKAGSAKLGMTITQYAAGDDSLILYERYLPYRGILGG